MKWLGIAAIAACGRVDFAPVATTAVDDGGTPIHLDGAATTDGSETDATASIDAAPNLCAGATIATVGTRPAETTCVANLVDGCGPANTQERIYKFVAPATAGYNFEALDATDNTIMNSIGVLDAACQPAGICAGLYSTSYSAGDVVYFAVEASAGGCVSVRVEITQGP